MHVVPAVPAGRGWDTAEGPKLARPRLQTPPVGLQVRACPGSRASGLAASWEIPKEGSRTLGTPLWWPWRWRCHSRGAWPGSDPTRTPGVGLGFLGSISVLGAFLGLSLGWGHHKA